MDTEIKSATGEKNIQAPQGKDCCAAKDKSAKAQQSAVKPAPKADGSCCCGSKGHHPAG